MTRKELINELLKHGDDDTEVRVGYTWHDHDVESVFLTTTTWHSNGIKLIDGLVL